MLQQQICVENKHLLFDSDCKIWLLFSRNLEDPSVPVYSVKGHTEIINCIDGVGGLGIGEGAPEIVTGSRDGITGIYSKQKTINKRYRKIRRAA